MKSPREKWCGKGSTWPDHEDKEDKPRQEGSENWRLGNVKIKAEEGEEPEKVRDTC